MFHDHRNPAIAAPVDTTGAVLLSGLKKPIYFPNALDSGAKDDILVSNGKIITTVFDPDRQGATVGVAFASTSVPTRLSYRNIVEPAGPIGAGFAPGNGWEVNGLSANNDYVFALGADTQTGELRVTRIDRFTSGREQLATGLGSDPEVEAYSCVASAASDSYVFIAARRQNLGSPETHDAVLIVIDLADFTATGVSVVTLSSGGGYAIALDVAVVGNRVLVTSVFASVGSDPFLAGWRLHRYHYKDETLDTVTPDYPLGRSCVANGSVYYLPANDVYRGIISQVVEMQNTKGAKVNPANLDAIEYFDIAADSNVTLQQGGQRPWTDGTYLYFLANNVGFFPSSYVLTPGYVNAPYLAKFDLATLAPQTGLDLTRYFNNLEYQVSAGGYENGFHYLGGWAIALTSSYRHGGGCILKVARDFTYAIFYPASDSPPDNDSFPGRRLLINVTKTFDNRWATKEAGEPNHGGNVGGKSVWYTFIAPTSSVYRITIRSEFASNVAVYRGTVIEGLTQIGVIDDGYIGYSDPRTLNFNAYAGGRYRIAIDGWYGAPGDLANTDDETAITQFGRGTIRIEAIDTAPNDNFANAITLTVGSSASADNRYATAEPDEPAHAGTSAKKSLWWKFTVDEARDVQVRIPSSRCPVKLAVYTEGSPAGVGGLVEVASIADDSAGSDDDYAAWSCL